MDKKENDEIPREEQAEIVEQKKKQRGRPATKNGNYDRKTYYKTFMEKHPNKVLCECGKSLTYFSLDKHKRRPFHMLTMKLKELTQNTTPQK